MKNILLTFGVACGVMFGTAAYAETFNANTLRQNQQKHKEADLVSAESAFIAYIKKQINQTNYKGENSFSLEKGSVIQAHYGTTDWTNAEYRYASMVDKNDIYSFVIDDNQQIIDLAYANDKILVRMKRYFSEKGFKIQINSRGTLFISW